MCCSTKHAVPVVDKAKFKFLKSRTDLWHTFKPYDAATREIVDELHHTCAAIECKGARHCERDNRSVACRAFPFYPYITREGDFVGLGTYWTYEDRCWLMSNMKVVEREIVQEFVAAYEYIFSRDRGGIRDHEGAFRLPPPGVQPARQAIPLIGREGGYLQVLPRSVDVSCRCRPAACPSSPPTSRRGPTARRWGTPAGKRSHGVLNL